MTMYIQRVKKTDKPLPGFASVTAHYAAKLDGQYNVVQWSSTVAGATDFDAQTCKKVLERYAVRGEKAGAIELYDPTATPKKSQETAKEAAK